ncbi:acyl-CoA synthetase [Microbacterium paludicola]|uniref:Acyl-CoA synthetase n=1 Tax=Microbacterium paludicola TaxID=300019 RepID=A0A4Y9FTG4_9MICO|nr:acyl-CoA synthetase [Microbacterium paludicola]MBF0817023.1 acyl-CoA synthetase [Microbacterium paludicola]TFU32276.1 acyl-CoA synthetase [Microbacterium paludicola]
MPASTPLRVTSGHIQLLRALFAAIAALMITFSPDHSSEVGLAVFGGFGIATGLVFAVAAWLVAPAGQRGSAILLAAIHLAAGMAASAVVLRSDTLFFVVVIAWALLAGLTELLAAILQRARLDRSAARDGIAVGGLTMLLGVALLFVSPSYELHYFIEEAGREFTLTGTTIAVGLLGGYAAIAAVFLGIAGLSPQPAAATETDAAVTAQEDRP